MSFFMLANSSFVTLPLGDPGQGADVQAEDKAKSKYPSPGHSLHSTSSGVRNLFFVDVF
jgi:hypothetical protein